MEGGGVARNAKVQHLQSSTATIGPKCSSETCLVREGVGKTKFKRCGGCRQMWYCSTHCQVTHWRSSHGKECRQLQQQKALQSMEACLLVEPALQHPGGMIQEPNPSETAQVSTQPDEAVVSTVGSQLRFDDVAQLDATNVHVCNALSGAIPDLKPETHRVRTATETCLNIDGEDVAVAHSLEATARIQHTDEATRQIAEELPGASEGRNPTANNTDACVGNGNAACGDIGGYLPKHVDENDSLLYDLD